MDDDLGANSSKHLSKQAIHRADSRHLGIVNELSPDTACLSTASGGQRPDDGVRPGDDPAVDNTGSEPPGPTDLASGALAAARSMARGRASASTGLPGQSGGVKRRRRRNPNAPVSYAGAHPDERDPLSIAAIVGKALPELGWVGPLATARLLGQWELVVGVDIASHCHPTSLADGDLKIVAESTAWATQLRLMAPRMLAKICADVPSGMVKRLVITGPSGPSWKHGPWAMRGRGVRDTYG